MMMNKTNCGDVEVRAARRSRLRRSAVAAAAALVGLTIVGCGTPVSTDTPRAKSADQNSTVTDIAASDTAEATTLATTPVKATTPTATTLPTTTAASTVPSTTLPATTVAPTTVAATTTTDPDLTISSGTYIVGSEIQPGMYRVAGYWARLDASMDIIDNDGVYRDGFGMLNVRDTDAYIEISGAAMPLSATRALDPSVEGFTGGTYLVNWDIQPGRYRVAGTDGMAYYARLDANGEIIDNNISDGDVIVIVAARDWALSITGTITPL